MFGRRAHGGAGVCVWKCYVRSVCAFLVGECVVYVRSLWARFGCFVLSVCACECNMVHVFIFACVRFWCSVGLSCALSMAVCAFAFRCVCLCMFVGLNICIIVLSSLFLPPACCCWCSFDPHLHGVAVHFHASDRHPANVGGCCSLLLSSLVV